MPWESPDWHMPFAKMGHSAPALFGYIDDQAVLRVEEFTPRQLATLAWAFARVGPALHP